MPNLYEDDEPLIAALRERGHHPVPAVWTDAGVDWGDFDACIIRSTWDYADKRDAFVAWAQRVSQCTRLWNPADVVQWNTDKRYLRDLTARGIAVVETIGLERGETADVASLCKERDWPAIVIKPVVGATARETIRAERSDLAAAQAHLDRLLPREAMLVQPFLPRVETDGELSLMYFGGRFSHAVIKRAAAGDYRVQNEFGGTYDGAAVSADTVKLGERILSVVQQPTLYARIDLVPDGDGSLVLMELELVEPMLYLKCDAAPAGRFVQAVEAAMSGETSARG